MGELPIAQEGDSTVVLSRLSAHVVQAVEPVGRWYEAYITRRQHSTSSHHSLGSDSDDSSSSDESLDSETEDDAFLLTLDPKEWKNQDHYRVMGLTKLRHRASEDQIKKAYKKKVLQHHPDKQSGHKQTKPVLNEDFFTCLTKAHEILSNRTKRRAYDSVDPLFDDAVPSVNAQSKANFYETFGPVIESNARWSNTEPVPLLGHENSTFEEVDKFYSFWYDFDSWREFSYLDEEEKEKGENRDERRWIEKENRAMRQKRKKEEIKRLRTLVDNVYACDPRIKKFKEEEKERKLAEKKAKEDAAKAAAEEKERQRQEALEAERLAKEKEEQLAKEKATQAKKEKEKLKAAMKKERKSIRAICKNYDYFVTEEAEKIEEMQILDKLLEDLSLEGLQTFREDMNKAGNKDKAKSVYEKQLQALKDRRKQDEESKKIAALRTKKEMEVKEEADQEWSDEQLQLLVKAVNLFPAGTVSRWRVIADYVNDHAKTGNKREPKHVIVKVKSLKKIDPTQIENVNKKAFAKFDLSHTQGKASEESVPTVRYELENAAAASAPPEKPEKPWSSDDQKLLEAALRAIPASTPERWDRVAESVPGRTKKECMKRYKELVEMIKAKKAAQTKQAK
ncbi:dnaJ homolog subfamily C member 2 [Nematostella vectensis]|uniref:dnaJ homolog subfamily C member 2 n=1 Tax=Nematostella vectensis TaxID=45351 RepID=UPI00207785FD|nr:dnaJ homolog subfamily C member 2 [Nematostella vectensis]XP_032218837.2 dnaJ homolog subfamily C member 2 [Nematostella vectensis]XP_048587911.1 dnaJ homolog subfamily C member 2 [Nematostella vectensis]